LQSLGQLEHRLDHSLLSELEIAANFGMLGEALFFRTFFEQFRLSRASASSCTTLSGSR
jgi:hypothetical protein